VEILSTDEELQRVAESEGVRVLPLDVIWREIRPWKDLMGLYRLYRHLRANRYTFVHTHTSKAGFIGRIAAELAGVPIVVHTAHGFAFHESSPRWKILFYTALERLASLGCRRVVAVSRFHEQWGKRLGIAAAEKIVAIPNGIPAPPPVSLEQALAIRRKWNIQTGEVVVMTPGRLAPEKGLEDMIDAVSALPQAMLERIRVVIAGEGVLRAALERRITSLGLKERIELIGFQQNVPALLAAADIVLLPTWREGLSIALLEAMSQGCAIITTSIGSNLEATEHGAAALVVPPKQPALLADAICELVNNPSRRESLRRRARGIYAEKYTQDRMLSGYHKLYTGLLKEIEGAQSVSPVLSSSHR
jgi:glycosyltransferase involved in cell wall biosynthesis